MKGFIVVVLLIFCLESIFSLSSDDKYWSTSDWSGQDGIGKIAASGQINTTVTVKIVSPESLEIHISKEMTPFGQVLDFDAIALLKNGKYEFRTIDNWGNLAFGYVEDMGNSIQFRLDCDEFSDDGKDLGRLYGELHELEKKRD